MLRLITLLAFLAAIAQAKIRIPDLPHSLREREEFRFGVVEDDSKIVGGEEVDPNSIPYQVSVQVRNLVFSMSCYHAFL